MNTDSTSPTLSAAPGVATDAGPVSQEVLDYFEGADAPVAGPDGAGPDPLSEAVVDGGSAPEELLVEISNAPVRGEEPIDGESGDFEAAIDTGGPPQEALDVFESGEASFPEEAEVQDVTTSAAPVEDRAGDDGCCP